ncbi:MAG TPA: hypothetical protein VMN39_10155, partial [Longimicrobiaceae bacterium]|nr:hypothetical protein [Longimicrobiaceae bacterium]
MAITTAQLREKIGEFSRLAGEWAKLHRFWFEALGVTLLALLVLAVFGAVALRRASAWETQAERLREIEEVGARLLAEFEPADSTETAEWSESHRLLRQMTGIGLDPLSTASLVAERTEEVGISSTRVSLIAADTAGVPGS